LSFAIDFGTDHYDTGKKIAYDTDINDIYDNGPSSRTNSLTKKKQFSSSQNSYSFAVAGGVANSNSLVNVGKYNTTGRIRSPSIVKSKAFFFRQYKHYFTGN
jgi:hypothetical protein